MRSWAFIHFSLENTEKDRTDHYKVTMDLTKEEMMICYILAYISK